MSSSYRHALLFPGQGSHSIGMADGLAEYSWAREAYSCASDQTGTDLLALCASGPEDVLARTEFAQVAIFVTSYCLVRLAGEKFETVTSSAGHSLGEYTALVAAGSIGFVDAVSVVAERAAAMADACEANPGGMSAVLGLEWDVVDRLCSERRDAGGEIWAANQNAPGQSVIAGSIDDLTWFAEHGKELGAKRVIPLSVSGAFHSPFMAPAAERLRSALKAVEVTEPAYQVWSNATGAVHGGSEAIKTCLVEQLTSPVRWTDCLHGIAEAGIDQLVCIGPGDAISGMARRSVSDVEIVRAESAEAVVALDVSVVTS